MTLCNFWLFTVIWLLSDIEPIGYILSYGNIKILFIHNNYNKQISTAHVHLWQHLLKEFHF